MAIICRFPFISGDLSREFEGLPSCNLNIVVAKVLRSNDFWLVSPGVVQDDLPFTEIIHGRSHGITVLFELLNPAIESITDCLKCASILGCGALEKINLVCNRRIKIIDFLLSHIVVWLERTLLISELIDLGLSCQLVLGELVLEGFELGGHACNGIRHGIGHLSRIFVASLLTVRYTALVKLGCVVQGKQACWCAQWYQSSLVTVEHFLHFWFD